MSLDFPIQQGGNATGEWAIERATLTDADAAIGDVVVIEISEQPLRGISPTFNPGT